MQKCYASYAGMTRIRFKGRRSHLPLSPFTDSPFFGCFQYNRRNSICQAFFCFTRRLAATRQARLKHSATYSSGDMAL